MECIARGVVASPFPNIFLATSVQASVLENLIGLGVGGLISTDSRCFYTAVFDCLSLGVPADGEGLLAKLPDAVAFIDRKLSELEKVLIYSAVGSGTASAVAIAWMIQSEEMTLKEALQTAMRLCPKLCLGRKELLMLGEWEYDLRGALSIDSASDLGDVPRLPRVVLDPIDEKVRALLEEIEGSGLETAFRRHLPEEGEIEEEVKQALRVALFRYGLRRTLDAPSIAVVAKQLTEDRTALQRATLLADGGPTPYYRALGAGVGEGIAQSTARRDEVGVLAVKALLENPKALQCDLQAVLSVLHSAALVEVKAEVLAATARWLLGDLSQWEASSNLQPLAALREAAMLHKSGDTGQAAARVAAVESYVRSRVLIPGLLLSRPHKPADVNAVAEQVAEFCAWLPDAPKFASLAASLCELVTSTASHDPGLPPHTLRSLPAAPFPNLPPPSTLPDPFAGIAHTLEAGFSQRHPGRVARCNPALGTVELSWGAVRVVVPTPCAVILVAGFQVADCAEVCDLQERSRLDPASFHPALCFLLARRSPRTGTAMCRAMQDGHPVKISPAVRLGLAELPSNSVISLNPDFPGKGGKVDLTGSQGHTFAK